MALSPETLASIEEAKSAIEDWRDKELLRLQADANFLKLIRAPVSTLSSSARKQATEATETLINDVLGS